MTARATDPADPPPGHPGTRSDGPDPDIPEPDVSDPDPDDPESGSKAWWRRRMFAARRATAPAVRAERAAALTRAALDLAAGVTGPVCAYLPIGTEPWSADGVEALRAAGHEVLLPVVTGASPLDWARYEGPDSLGEGPIGLREPLGRRLGADAVGRAALVLVPALATDRSGVRLGRGAGHYDRSLGLTRPGTPLVTVLDDHELVDRLPADPHDRPVTAVLRPGSGLTPVGPGLHPLGKNA